MRSMWLSMRWAVHRLLRTTLRFFPDFRDDVPGWPELAGRWHRHVLDAFLQGRPDEARKAAEDHVREAGEILVAHARSLGLWSDAEADAGTAAAAGSAPR